MKLKINPPKLAPEDRQPVQDISKAAVVLLWCIIIAGFIVTWQDVVIPFNSVP